MLDIDTPRKGEPMRHPETEQLLAELGIDHATPVMVPVADINVDASRAAQVRDTDTDPDTIDRYTDLLADGAQLPAVVVRDANTGPRVIAGLHRLEAYLNAGRTEIPGYQIACSDPVAYELAVRSNTSHGLPLTRNERTKGAVTLVTRHGHTREDAARKVGVSVATVNRGMAEIRGRTRARKMRIDGHWNKIGTLGARIAIASIGTDEVFSDAVEITARLGLNATQAQDLADRVNRRSSLEGQHEALDEFEMEHDAGSGRPATKKATEITQAAAARRHMFELVDLDVDAIAAGCLADQTETTADMARNVAAKLTELADRLDNDKAVAS